MAQPTVIVATLAVIVALGGLAYVNASRNNEVTAAEAPAPVRAELPPAPAPTPVTAVSEPEVAPPVRIASTDVDRWITETQSNDAKTRAVAIEALANAPKARALPALERVLESGEPQVDRQIALRSLHLLALNDGDENGAIRDVIRHAMYHSEDEGVTQSAQAFLEDIEAAFDERTQPR